METTQQLTPKDNYFPNSIHRYCIDSSVGKYDYLAKFKINGVMNSREITEEQYNLLLPFFV